MIKRFLPTLAALFLFAAVSSAQTGSTPSILPKPIKMEAGNVNAKFTLTPEAKIVCKFDDKNLKFALNELDRLTTEIFGVKFKRSSTISEMEILERNAKNIWSYVNGLLLQTIKRIVIS